jgi:hypothetical protein
VDCIRESDKRAYEIKLRVTIAASGQGRWGEELDFPADARASGYTPVLVVLDSTPNPKLAELRAAFRKQKGETYIGGDAWKHLEQKAGATMAKFLDNYVLAPLKSLLDEAPDAPENVPDLIVRAKKGRLLIQIGNEKLEIRRDEKAELGAQSNEISEDEEGHIPTP